MSRLVSGKVLKIPSANVSADRYEFLKLEEAEPDLGLPTSSGQVLASNTDGGRFFVTLNTNNVTEADNLYYTNDRVAAYLENAGTPLSIGDLYVSGNLVVDGDTTTLNTATLVVEDKNIVLANGAPDGATADGAGITIAGADANIVYNDTTATFDINIGLYVNQGVDTGTIKGEGVLNLNAQHNPNSYIQLNETDDNYFAHETGNLILISGTKEYKFDQDGKFTAPGEIYGKYFTLYGGQPLGAYIGYLGYSGNIVTVQGTYGARINVGDEEGGIYWDFDTNGTLTAPGNVIANVIGTVSSLDNHTTTDLTEGNNLYYTNARVEAYVNTLTLTADISANTTDDLQEGDNNLYYTNARVDSRIAETSINVLADVLLTDIQDEDSLVYDAATGKFKNVPINEALAANLAELVLNLSLNSTDQLQEGSNNLYFTSDRVIESLQAGRGITISQSGLIASIDDSADFNLLTDGGVGYIVTDSLANALVLPSPADTGDRYIVRSIQVTNISDDIAYLNSNVVLSGYETHLAYKVPIPVGGSIEMLKRAHAFNRNDSITMQGLDASQTPASNLLAVSFAYETVPTTPGLFGLGTLITSGNTNVLVANTGSTYAVIESIKLINSGENQSTAKVIWTDANDIVQSYFSYNLSLPTNTSIEVLTGSKRINRSDKLYVQTNNDNPVSVIVSGRLGDVTTLVSYSSAFPSGLSSTIYYDTELEDGTTIYYSIE